MNPASWLTAARPRTLSLSITPVVVGTALAWAAAGQIRWPAVLAALVASMAIQLGTNLHNDAADSERGGDGPDRVGPPRATASGLLSARAVKRGACACFGLSALLGLYLIAVGGWPILLLGAASIAAGWAYTGGPWPIAYTPLGEVVRDRLLRRRRGRRHFLAVHRNARRAGARRGFCARPADRGGAAGQ